MLPWSITVFSSQQEKLLAVLRFLQSTSKLYDSIVNQLYILIIKSWYNKTVLQDFKDASTSTICKNTKDESTVITTAISTTAISLLVFGKLLASIPFGWLVILTDKKFPESIVVVVYY